MAGGRQKSKSVTEFGDFQTPPSLALAVTEMLVAIGIKPRAILEPTCGRGSFLGAAVKCFPDARRIVGVDINPHHLKVAKVAAPGETVELLQGNFFKLDWSGLISKEEGPWLILGNPPWVTSSALGTIESDNLPEKSNFHGRAGIEAITGKSNFDISEWMLLRYLEWLKKRAGSIGVLCKTTVARKILYSIWKRAAPLRAAYLFKIDALEHFNAAVDACFFILDIDENTTATTCDVYKTLNRNAPRRTIGFAGGHIIEDLEAFQRQWHLYGPEDRYIWRSGIKHDCSKVMELAITSAGYQSISGDTLTLEDTFLYPMLKSSDLNNGRHCRYAMLVTQQFVGQDTACIRSMAPKTWDYLQRHKDQLGRRGSTIYKKKPEFSIFGVGPYSFSPWKVAISGFYKRLTFTPIGPANGKAVVFDDTIYFLPCGSKEEAGFLSYLLNSPLAREFYSAMIHWEEKRPITIDILKRLSLEKLAAVMGCASEYKN